MARDNKKMQREMEAARNELAFMKAGITPDTKLARLFIAAYDGPIEAEAIAAAWAELLPPAPAVTVDEFGYPVEPEAPGVTFAPGEEESTAERNALANGPSGAEKSWTPDPRDVALAAGRKVIDDGGTEMDGLATHFAHLVAAAQAGDSRVIFNPR